MKSKTSILLTTLLALTVLLSVAWPTFAMPPAPVTLDPKTIPKFTNQLLGPPPVWNYTVEGSGSNINHTYTIEMKQTTQQILPTLDAKGKQTGFGPTTVWAYAGDVIGLGGLPVHYEGTPGATFEATRGIPIKVEWINNLPLSHLFAVDPTLHWANPKGIDHMMAMLLSKTLGAPPFPPGYNGAPYIAPGTTVNLNPFSWNAQSPVPIIPHLHGGEVQSTSDGHPEAWFTPDGLQGPAYNSIDAGDLDTNKATFYYPNEQPPTTLWYHDHALGITRINVLSGLAGFYLLREPADPVENVLTSKGILPAYEMPLVIQDRTFQPNGEFYFPSVGINPEHPYWLPEFFGDTIMVNGLVWPNMDVQKGWYRFRLLDGSNARFYTLSFSNRMSFWQIGSDGGYLKAPVQLQEMTIAPGERVDILVDFTNVPVGTKVVLKNTAKAPFPGGAPADRRTVGEVMQFTVVGTSGQPPFNPSIDFQTIMPFNPTLTPQDPNVAWPTLLPGSPVPNINPRYLVLFEVMGPGGPLEILLNGQKWDAPVSEKPTLGTTEDWVIINPTADTHPIHLHLVQFQLVYRQQFFANKYVKDWTTINGMPPFYWTPQTLNPALYLKGTQVFPTQSEQGWKDTIQVNPGEITVIRVRFAPIDQTTLNTPYPFDANVGPGYVWHCHILDHEDNEMMRPYSVLP